MTFAMQPVAPWWRRPYSALTLLVLACVYLPVSLRPAEWQDVYVPAAQRLLTGANPYSHSFCYLPFAAVMAIPFAQLPATASRLAWFACNAVALVVLVWAAWRTADGRCLERPGTPWREHLILGLGLLVGFRFAWNSLAHQQTDVLIGAALLAGCWALASGRPWLSAVLFGLSASIKAVPIGWAGYLLWRGHKGPAVALVAVTLGVNLTPELIAPPARGGTWLQVWMQRYGSLLTRSDANAGQWLTDPIYNQSIAGTTFRFSATAWTENDGPWRTTRRADAWPPATLRGVVWGMQGALAVVVLLCLERPRWRPLPWTPMAAPQRLALECSAIVLSMLLLAPMTGKAHCGVLLFPAFCLARLGFEERRWGLLAVVGVVGVLNVLNEKSVVGAAFSDAGLWAGVLTWQLLLLLAGCCYGLLKYRAAPAVLREDQPFGESRSRRAA